MTQWRKSSHSHGQAQSDCVEVAELVPGIGVRDSKSPETTHLTLAPEAFADFIDQIKNGELDL